MRLVFKPPLNERKDQHEFFSISFCFSFHTYLLNLVRLPSNIFWSMTTWIHVCVCSMSSVYNIWYVWSLRPYPFTDGFLLIFVSTWNNWTQKTTNFFSIAHEQNINSAKIVSNYIRTSDKKAPTQHNANRLVLANKFQTCVLIWLITDFLFDVADSIVSIFTGSIFDFQSFSSPHTQQQIHTNREIINPTNEATKE